MLHRLKHTDDHGNADSSHTTAPDTIMSESKGPRRRSSALRFFASSSSKPESQIPSHEKWEAEYLKDLRVNRPTRPGGSRPLPDRSKDFTLETNGRAMSAMSFRPSCPPYEPSVLYSEPQERSASATSHRRAQSDIQKVNTAVDYHGRPLVRPLHANKTSRDFSASTASATVPSGGPDLAYRESGMRWMEKQEARSLREAMEDMDHRSDLKLHAAAQEEASELVWQHKSKDASASVSQRPYKYKEHLQKGAHARSQSQGWYGSIGRNGILVSGQRSASSNSGSSNSGNETSQTYHGKDAASKCQTTTGDTAQHGEPRSHPLWDSSEKKAYMTLIPSVLSKGSGRRRSSGPRARNVSGGLFRNPNDKIYEETDEMKPGMADTRLKDGNAPSPLATKARNPISKVQTASQSFMWAKDTPLENNSCINRSEIHRNPPSQSRNPSYMKNEISSSLPETPEDSQHNYCSEKPLTKEGLEVRGDDIRAATSVRMKDRSPKLPSPTVVSDRPGRAIVSFDQDWKPKHTLPEDQHAANRPSGLPIRLRPKPQMPASTNSAPIIPTIHVPEPPSIRVNSANTNAPLSIPSISVPKISIPAISLPDESTPTRSRPLPTLSNDSRPSPAKRPLPRHSATTPVHTSGPHWSPSSHRATAQCAACALPISGRIVSAAKQRFHPHCFTCHHCAEPLECVAFYPEPDQKRTERLARIEARLRNDLPEDECPGETAQDDGDPSLRFYCHLDFHELYSPRCRSCKTPIESEVVVACGGSWHVGHFFCAECGDPFDAKTPFVEKDGYAWCVRCHAGRFSGKCRGCKKPVVETGITALGAEWHEQCFLCMECGGGFADGRFFTREEEAKPVCVGCEERRLKA